MFRTLGVLILAAVAFHARASGDLTEAEKAAIEDAVERAMIAGSSSLSSATQVWQSYGSKTSQRWVQIVQGRSGTTFYVDMRAIGGSERAPELWVRTEVPVGTFESAPATTEVKQLTVFSCSTRETAELQWTFFDKSGAVVSRGQGSRHARSAVSPDSTMEAVFDFVCN